MKMERVRSLFLQFISKKVRFLPQFDTIFVLLFCYSLYVVIKFIIYKMKRIGE